LHLPNGGRLNLGKLEFYEGRIIIALNITNMTVYGKILSLDFKSAYTTTTYGIPRYEHTPYIINIIKFGGLVVVNGWRMLKYGVTLPKQFSMLNVDNLYLGYYDDYIALGLTPFFKKAPK